MRWIEGYENKYSCDSLGRVFRHHKNGKIRELKGYIKKNKHVVKLTKSGKCEERTVSRIIYKAWIGHIPHGMIVIRKNGILRDSHPDNLYLTTPRKHNKKTGALSRSKPVELLNDDGEVIDSWPSARKAAKDLFVSYQTVMDICNKRVKKAPLLNVRWERVG